MYTASGVAVCVEIVRVLNTLIASGQLRPPRRAIRLLNGYECYGFFHYLEHQLSRFETPLAGRCIDTGGARPDLSDGRLDWHQTVPASAGVVADVGHAFLQAALALDNAGYTLESRPFRSTEDTLLGDPRYGFPCPWLTNHPCTGYHSSADTIEMLHPAGLAMCTAFAAAYLYYLADAATPEVLELAHWQTARTVANLRTAGTTPAQSRFAVQRHATNLDRLQRWLLGRPAGGGDGSIGRVPAPGRGCGQGIGTTRRADGGGTAPRSGSPRAVGSDCREYLAAHHHGDWWRT